MKTIVVNSPFLANWIETKTGIAPSLCVTRDGSLLYIFNLQKQHNTTTE